MRKISTRDPEELLPNRIDNSDLDRMAYPSVMSVNKVPSSVNIGLQKQKPKPNDLKSYNKANSEAKHTPILMLSAGTVYMPVRDRAHSLNQSFCLPSDILIPSFLQGSCVND